MIIFAFGGFTQDYVFACLVLLVDLHKCALWAGQVCIDTANMFHVSYINLALTEEYVLNQHVPFMLLTFPYSTLCQYISITE